MNAVEPRKLQLHIGRFSTSGGGLQDRAAAPGGGLWIPCGPNAENEKAESRMCRLDRPSGGMPVTSAGVLPASPIWGNLMGLGPLNRRGGGVGGDGYPLRPCAEEPARVCRS